MRTALLLPLLAACQPEPVATWVDVAPVVEARCTGCHQPDDIAPFSLETWDVASLHQDEIRDEVASNRMPPWKPSADCNTYGGDFDLTPSERALLLAWVDGGAVQGEPIDPLVPPEADPFVPDLVLDLPLAYTPGTHADDYRCQLVPWPALHPTWVTGLRVEPDRRELVHHTIVYTARADQRAALEALDAADPGPGWTCFGGPTNASGNLAERVEGLTPAEVGDLFQSGEIGGTAGVSGSIGSWVPGVSGGSLPEGTGIGVEPGSVLVVQMHYNTHSAPPAPDRSQILVTLSDSVLRPGIIEPYTSPGWLTGLGWMGGPMTIPAGEPDVTHVYTSQRGGFLMERARARLGLPDGTPLLVHRVGHHMHQLGTSGQSSILHRDGSETCLLRIDDWDFHWQGNYSLAEPVLLTDDDALRLACTWDNSPENQPVEGQEPRDVEWGEGTADEMCLGSIYVTGP